MFKNILVPTDGSEFSRNAVRRAVAFAAETGATVTAFYASPDRIMACFPGALGTGQALPPAFGEQDDAEAAAILSFVEACCRDAGIPCRKRTAKSNVVYEAIIAAATEAGCDLIFMASHGRRGLGALLLGSETMKVLTHTTIPVLVCR